MVAGNPAQIAESARAYYNSLICDDVQMVPHGTSGLPATAPVIGPGAGAKTFAALLPTIPQGDDVVNAAGEHILAVPNGIADTRANHDQVANFPLQLNSAWREII